MKHSRLQVVALILFSAGAPSALDAQKVGYNYDHNVNFSQYRTYRWVDVGAQDGVDALTTQQIRSAIDDELAVKGMQRVDGDSSDLAIGFQTSLSREKQLSTYGSDWGYGSGWGTGWYGYGGVGMSSSTTTTSTITVGTLALDMYDASAKSLVWRGIATKTVDVTPNPEKRRKRLDKAAKKLLKGYPPSK